MSLYAIPTTDDSPQLREAIDDRMPGRLVGATAAGGTTTLDFRPDLSASETAFLDGLAAGRRFRADGTTLTEFRAARAAIVAHFQAASPTNAQRDAAIRGLARVVQRLAGE